MNTDSTAEARSADILVGSRNADLPVGRAAGTGIRSNHRALQLAHCSIFAKRSHLWRESFPLSAFPLLKRLVVEALAPFAPFRGQSDFRSLLSAFRF
jgi:hypothetical protein